MTRFSRWSQRKRGLEPTDEQTSERALTPGEEGSVYDSVIQDHSVTDSRPTADSEATPSQEAVEELPDPATLPPGSDLTAYLANGVSREVRRRALKRMFAADHYHHRDGLNDYDDDYRQLKNLSQEVADRLRQWTRQPGDQGEVTQPEQAERDDNPPADAAGAEREDTPEAGEASRSDDQPQPAGRGEDQTAPSQSERDARLNAPSPDRQEGEATPPFPEKDQTEKNR
ncbi:MAG: DUF3306 domain-containing protein [Onishia taeanensis]|uniref:DUF3306 domain-containing protein n=1 Tax=Onishia taeanensis TaxID=284577 RepID=UPI003C7B7F58